MATFKLIFSKYENGKFLFNAVDTAGNTVKEITLDDNFVNENQCEIVYNAEMFTEQDFCSTLQMTEFYNLLPANVLKVWEDNTFEDMDYTDCEKLVIKLNEIGWNCEYSLDALPYDLRPIEFKDVK